MPTPKTPKKTTVVTSTAPRPAPVRDERGEPATPAAPKAAKPRKPKLEAGAVLFVQVGRMHKRAMHLLKRVRRWHNAEEVVTRFNAVEEAIIKLQCEIEDLPAGFVPDLGPSRAGGGGGGKALPVGVSCVVRDKVRPSYEGILTTAEMNNLIVVEVRAKGRVLCKTGDGEKIVMPRGHLSQVVSL